MPKYTIHVPHFKADNQGVPTTAAYEVSAKFIKQVAMVAGGCTVVSTDAVGYWNAGSALGMITEEQTVVEVVCSSSLWHYELLPLVSQLKVDLNQTAVFVTAVNEDIIFIP
jgi:hypothetical protein